ncbi:hypothetical protein NMG60_11036297 [Bertholletia excelsa]
MAETPLKRQREETYVTEDVDDPKRQKSYNQILSLLEEKEEEPDQDFSSIMTSLQRELSSELDPDVGEISPAGPSRESPALSPTAAHGELKGNVEGEDERERVMRHLLEASDDELGIPNTAAGDDDTVACGGDAAALSDGLWELEDEVANYYALLQSELFM